ncbi:hypothetical protein XU18_1229 [Perkinsela sp. CCAP 1560/4]|nr:hypothetical protein XU18_1229 [Perkinsela sp. CCAP 1560/4]|eukprot:KNH08221.1 hypothetical protein XU18_1229 [Perkinsela sp. CCAP 1560/4]
MEARETCTKCGFDAKTVSICPVLKTHHALLTKSLFRISSIPIAKVKEEPNECVASGKESDNMLHDLCRRSYLVMAGLLSQKTEAGRRTCISKIREFDSYPKSRVWATLKTGDLCISGGDSDTCNKLQANKVKVDQSPGDGIPSKPKTPAINLGIDMNDPTEAARRKLRLNRFGTAQLRSSEPPVSGCGSAGMRSVATAHHQEEKIVGRSTTLEKPYFRLQEAPNPADVRPLHVLMEAFSFVKNKARSMPNEKSQAYLNEQLKSIRQDISIQQIENVFAIEVYETQARLSLELFDHVEFNQSQSRLKSLYEKLQHWDSSQSALKNASEFRNYRLLYSAIMQNDFAVSADISLLAHLLQSDRDLQYTIDLTCAISENIPALIFALFRVSTKLSYGIWVRCLLRKLFLIRRSRWCITLLATCGPNETMSIESLSRFLGFQLDDENWEDVSESRLCAAVERALEFLGTMKVTICSDHGELCSDAFDDQYFIQNKYKHCFVYCTPAAKQISDYLTYVHTRSDARHAMAKSDIL